MSIRTIKLDIVNNNGEKLTFEAMNMSDAPTNPEEFSKLIMSVMKQVGEATTIHPGFIEFKENDSD